MSYTDHPVQRRLKSNVPNESVQWTHISTSAIQIWWHTPPFHYKHQDGGEKIWKKCDYIRAPNTCFNHRHKSYTKIHAQSCQPDTERHSASCHVCWDAVICTYFVVIECFDWNKFVWIKVLFWRIIIVLICCIWTGQGCTLVTHETNAQHYVFFVSLHHFHHVWCACRSQEECTDSDVSCSRPKHFLHFRFFCYRPTSSFVIFFILSSFLKYIYIYIYIYIYFPLPFPNLPEFTFFSYLATFCEKWRLLRVFLEIFWGRGLATLVMSVFYSKTQANQQRACMSFERIFDTLVEVTKKTSYKNRGTKLVPPLCSANFCVVEMLQCNMSSSESRFVIASM